MTQWTVKKPQDYEKLRTLVEVYLIKEEYQRRYYSYSIIDRAVRYIDGKLRMYGRRIE
jgi:hypothetical protein